MSAPRSTATKTVKKAESGKIASAKDFKAKKKGSLLPLPSGLVVRARRVELQTFLLKGSVPNPLMEIMSQALEKGQKADVAQIMGVEDGKMNLDAINDMYEMVNAVTIQSIVEPKVHPVPLDDEGKAVDEDHPQADEFRDDDLLYVDEVPDEDKMFLFHWLTGGTTDLESFRQEARASLDAVAEGPRRKNTTKRAAGTKKR